MDRDMMRLLMGAPATLLGFLVAGAGVYHYQQAQMLGCSTDRTYTFAMVFAAGVLINAKSVYTGCAGVAQVLTAWRGPRA